MFTFKLVISLLVISIQVFPASIIGKSHKGTLKEDSQETNEILPQPHPFYDAKILSDTVVNGILPENKIWTALNVIAKYTQDKSLKEKINSQPGLTKPFVEDLLRNKDKFTNPFLKRYVDLLDKALKLWLEKISGSLRTFRAVDNETTYAPEDKSPTKKGLVSPTVFVDALSTLIADRFKEELEIAFLKKFREKLDKKESGLGLIFPITTTFLLSTKIYNFKVFMPTLKEVFREDLKNFDQNTSAYLKQRLVIKKALEKELKELNKDSEEYKKAEKEIKNLKDEKNANLAIFCLELFHSIRTGKNPTIIINNLNSSEQLQYLDIEFSNPIRLLALASRNLTIPEGDGWLSSKDLKLLINKDAIYMRELFFGFIYALEMEEMANIKLGEKTLKSILENNPNNFRAINEYFQRVGVLAVNIDTEISKLKLKGKIEIEDYNTYLELIYDLVELAFDINQFAGNEANDKNILNYLEFAKEIMGFIKNITQGDYSLALANALTVLKEMFAEIPADLVKYTNFVISVANAKDATEMHKILEAAAMPVGSYRIVRCSPLSITLSAYPGFFGGKEALNTTEKILGDKIACALSFASPIGIAFSHGRGDYDKPGPSWTIFLSVVDIGPTVSWRLSKEDKGLPKLAWKNIFAPGFFIFFGLKSLPISIGGAIQYGPQLREIKGVEEAVIESSAFRYGVIIAVDIPLFNLYSKGK